MINQEANYNYHDYMLNHGASISFACSNLLDDDFLDDNPITDYTCTNGKMSKLTDLSVCRNKKLIYTPKLEKLEQIGDYVYKEEVDHLKPIILKCKVESKKTDLLFTLLKDGNKIEESTGNYLEMSIMSATEEHEGDYTCKVEKYGEEYSNDINKYLRIKIQYGLNWDPRIVPEHNTYYANTSGYVFLWEDKSNTLTCEYYRSEPGAKILWYKNGKLLPEKNDEILEVQSVEGLPDIYACQFELNGKYSKKSDPVEIHRIPEEVEELQISTINLKADADAGRFKTKLTLKNDQILLAPLDTTRVNKTDLNQLQKEYELLKKLRNAGVNTTLLDKEESAPKYYSILRTNWQDLKKYKIKEDEDHPFETNETKDLVYFVEMKQKNIAGPLIHAENTDDMITKKTDDMLKEISTKSQEFQMQFKKNFETDMENLEKYEETHKIKDLQFFIANDGSVMVMDPQDVLKHERTGYEWPSLRALVITHGYNLCEYLKTL
jgi:hypothetical protein